MTRTENITLTVFNPETEEYEDIRARVEFTLYVGRIEPFEADEYDWNILLIIFNPSSVRKIFFNFVALKPLLPSFD